MRRRLREDRRASSVIEKLILLALAALVSSCTLFSDSSLGERAETNVDAGDVGVDADRDVALDTDAEPGDTADASGDGDVQIDAGPEFNGCGGREPLRWDGDEASLGSTCGPCGEGRLVCNGPSNLRCAGAREPNVCGGCGALSGQPGEVCGPCGDGVWQCDETGAGGVVCTGESSRNDCGGCALLEGRPGSLCEVSDDTATWVCDGSDAVTCLVGELNACGGREPLAFEGTDANLGDPCDAPCGEGRLVCDGIDALRCAGGDVPNACGGCGPLPGAAGDECGPCGEQWECRDDGSLRCERQPLNACGGCDELPLQPGTTCDEGVRICTSTDLVICVGGSGGDNECGGETELIGRPDGACGTCNSGRWACEGTESVVCEGEIAERNPCGGCARLAAPPETPCGTCGTGSWTCAEDGESVECEGDLGDDARNSCGGCRELRGVEGEACGACAVWACHDTIDALRCVPDPDADPDVCATPITCAELRCAEESRRCVEAVGATDARCGECLPDFVDVDGTCEPEAECGDGVVDEGEECDDGDDNSDTERDACRLDCTAAGCGDGVIDTGELCDGDALGGRSCSDDGFDGGALWCADSCDAFDYSGCEGDCGVGAPDGDEDGVPDPCDPCPEDNPDDSDGDGVCDSDDVCAGGDDTVDGDADGVPDACDPCPEDNPDDSDGDGVCDSDDVCADGDDTVDGDEDGVPDACDPCPEDNPDDSDGDGVCDSDDVCADGDDTVDGDEDGVPDACDPCPEDNPDDSDGDGVCDSDDACPGGDDTVDGDEDGVPDACDGCPLDNPDDSDGDGVCDSDDVCAGGDDTVDGDEDGVPDACDVCPLDDPDDSDEDGVCDSDDICPANPNFDVDPNACGGCSNLAADPSEACGLGGSYACDGMDEVRCVDVVGAPCDEAGDCESGICATTGFCTPATAPEGFSYIPPGTFTMGSPPDELGRQGDENQHEVELTHGVFVHRTEVTQGQWEALMGNNPSWYETCGEECPVERVTWWDALAYANALSRREGLPECYTLSGCDAGFGEMPDCTDVKVNAPGEDVYACAGYRLPTESEWEHAYRAGTATALYNGALVATGCSDDPALDAIGWYCGNTRDTTSPVAAKLPNDWSLYDVSGNVAEWVWDLYGAYPSGPLSNPSGATTGVERVHRGGSRGNFAQDCRAASRARAAPGTSGFNLGFRVVRTARPDHCLDDELSGDETGVDCNGSCAPCRGGLADGEVCSASSECASRNCSNETCAPEGYSYIPPGTFSMGSPESEVGRDDEETQHEVELTRGFFFQQLEVTQGQWSSLMGNNPSFFSSCGDDCPVEKVTWWDALGYVNALSRREGLPECYTLSGCDADFGETPDCAEVTVNAADGNPYRCEGYRLPMESEWEYAYRAGTTTAFYNGDIDDASVDADLAEIAWYKENADGRSHPVGEKEPNAWGLYDMSGNVWEWTWDLWRPHPSGAVTDPLGGSTGTFRVRRGGSWLLDAHYARAASRFSSTTNTITSSLGIRVVRTAP